MAQVGKQFKAIEIDDAKIAEVTADTSSSYTVGTLIDIPNVVEIAPDPQFRSEQLEGDAVVDDIHSKVTHVNVQVTMRAVPLDVLEQVLGGTLAASGTTPNTKQTYTLKSTDTPKFFKLIGRWINAKGIDSTDGADAHLTLFKVKATGISWRLNGSWAEVQITGVALRSKNSDKILEIVFNESSTAIS